MKKIIFVFLVVFFLTGCSNSVTLDFKDNINTKIDLSFTLDEYRNYSKINDEEELISSIEAIRNDREAFIIGNGELFIEKNFSNNNNYYSANYEYNYNYVNFANNSLLNRCFEYFGLEKDDYNIYISLKGKSNCGAFKLNVKADDRMISSNEDEKVNNLYVWNIKENDNDIYMAISKEKVTTSSFNAWNVVYFSMALMIGVGAFIINKKINNS